MLNYHGPSKLLLENLQIQIARPRTAQLEQIRFEPDNKSQRRPKMSWRQGEVARANEPPTGPDFGQKWLVISNVMPAHTLRRGYQSQVGNVLVVTSQNRLQYNKNERRIALQQKPNDLTLCESAGLLCPNWGSGRGYYPSLHGEFQPSGDHLACDANL